VLSNYVDTGFTFGFGGPAPPVAGFTEPTDSDDFAPARWAHRNGGSELGVIQRRVVFQAGEKGVVVNDVRARIVKRHTAPASVVKKPSFAVIQGITYAAIDLDSAQKEADTYELGGEIGSPFFAAQTVALAPGESQTFNFYFMSSKCDCDFELVADVLVDGKQHDVVIRDRDGKPFSIGVLPPPVAAFPAGDYWQPGDCGSGQGLVWVPADPADQRDCLPVGG
jgi:hypothetical protein